jgi:hypothetical protein
VSTPSRSKRQPRTSSGRPSTTTLPAGGGRRWSGEFAAVEVLVGLADLVFRLHREWSTATTRPPGSRVPGGRYLSPGYGIVWAWVVVPARLPVGCGALWQARHGHCAPTGRRPRNGAGTERLKMCHPGDGDARRRSGPTRLTKMVNTPCRRTKLSPGAKQPL